MSNLSLHLDLNRLRTRVAQKPRTKMGQVRQAWPEIKDLLVAGHSLRDIWTWLNEIGLDIGYARLSHCITQLRLRDQAAQSPMQDFRRGFASVFPEERRLDGLPGRDQASRTVTSDPLQNLREQRARNKGFEYNPFPAKRLAE